MRPVVIWKDESVAYHACYRPRLDILALMTGSQLIIFSPPRLQWGEVYLKQWSSRYSVLPSLRLVLA